MIGRLWKTGLQAGRGEAYEAFAREVSLPMFRAQEGYLGCLMSRDDTTGLVLTLWRDADAVRALDTSPSYRATVERILAAEVLADPQETTVGSAHLIDVGRVLDVAQPGTARPARLAGGPDDGTGSTRVRDSYDTVAADYAASVAGVERKPFDMALLAQFAQMLPGAGPVWDLGCGPGDVTHCLHRLGVEVCGVDLSPAMIGEARRRHPDLAFQVGDLTRLDTPAGSLAGVTAFYSLIHVPPEQLGPVLAGIRRALRPGGLLVIAVHVDEPAIELREWFGKPVSLDGFFCDADQLSMTLRVAGFTIETSLTRPPYPDIEHPSRRLYLLARARK